ncbi:MAG: hypothetical protein JXB08_00975 [Bacilli bacterium]|nr:hypothetical protein [Bacilli bacterium]MBN2877221.1 hypothetical protein [Bacilli bacterium]
MKRIRNIVWILILGLLISPFFQTVHAEETIDIHFFHSQYCLHCKDMDTFFQSLEEEYDNINIIYYEISDQDNADLLEAVALTFNQKAEVPFVAIGGLSFVGYNTQTTYDIQATIDRYTANHYRTDIVNKVINGETVSIGDFDTLERSVVVLPLIGEVELESLSLLLSAVVLGLVDGFNPCAMWVLIFLITMLINYNDRKRMWIIGFTFLFTSALLYFLIMVSWLQLAVSLTAVLWIRYLIGAFALGFGGYHIYQYFKNRKQDVGCEVTDQTRRQKIIEQIKNIVKKQSLWLALVGVVVLAITVNLIELACSAGLPLLFTQILAYNNLGMGTYLMYIGIYVFFFLIDDLAIFIIAMITMKVTGVSNKYSKWSSVIGGIIMLLIGFLLIFFPNIIMFNF